MDLRTPPAEVRLPRAHSVYVANAGAIAIHQSMLSRAIWQSFRNTSVADAIRQAEDRRPVSRSWLGRFVVVVVVVPFPLFPRYRSVPPDGSFRSPSSRRRGHHRINALFSHRPNVLLRVSSVTTPDDAYEPEDMHAHGLAPIPKAVFNAVDEFAIPSAHPSSGQANFALKLSALPNLPDRRPPGSNSKTTPDPRFTPRALAQLVVVLNSSSRCSLMPYIGRSSRLRGVNAPVLFPLPSLFTRYNSPIGVLYARRLAIPWRRESGSLARRVPITRVLFVSGSNSISALFLEVCPGQHSCRCHAYWPCDRPSIEFNHVCCDSQWVSPRNTHRYSIG